MRVQFDNHSILQDFDQFLRHFETQKITLTKSQAVLKNKDLQEINATLSHPLPFVNRSSKMRQFSLISAFFYIAIESGIFRVVKNSLKGQHVIELNASRIASFHQLSDVQKYFTLLEGFITRIDWDVAYDCRSFFGQEFYVALSKAKVEVPVTVSDQETKRKGKLSPPLYLFVPEVLQAFGLFDLEWDPQITKRPWKYIFPYRSITVKPLGKMLLPPLLEMAFWGSTNQIHFFFSEDPSLKAPPETSFYDTFLPVIGGPAWNTSFFEQENTPFSGQYVLNIVLGKKLYRKVRVPSTFTLEELHLAIQSLYQFGNDHLYAFYLDGNPYSRKYAFHDERGGRHDEKLAKDYTLGTLDLYLGKEFLYVFDFGDNWTFLIQVLEVKPSNAKLKRTYTVLEEVGESPEQYPDFE